jgi:hypothetical protein
VEGKVLVDAAEASNEVILKRANGAFRCVAAMDTRRGQLEVDALSLKEVLERGRAFIVEAL